MSIIKELTDEIIAFRKERDWEKFHTKKDMFLSLMLEVSELLEHSQWKDESEFADYAKDNKEALGDELSDVLYWVLLLAHDLEIDLPESFKRKMEKNRKKYPSDLARSSAKKYDEL